MESIKNTLLLTKRTGIITTILLLLVLTNTASSQDSSSFLNKVISFPDKVFGKIDKEANGLEAKLNKQTDNYLNKLEKRELKLKSKLWKTDSTKAKEVFGDVKGRYDELRNTLHQKGDQFHSAGTAYIGHIDSLGTAMKFLKNNPVLQQGGAITDKINGNLKSVTSLQQSINQSDFIRKQILQRQQELKAKLQNTGLVKEFRKFRKNVYYYQQQAREYKEALEDPKKLGAKLLETAMKFPAFQEFFRNNSQLASMFRLPGGTDPTGMQSFAGLQTRADVQNILQQRIGSGPNAQQYVQQQMQTAQSEIQNLKNKVNHWSGGNADEIEMPDFKTNSQKTKSFLKRLEWGTNMQTSRGNLYFPVTSDLGLSVGFKASDRSLFGLGVSYKLGLGQNWEHIRLTHQGVGLRSFVDWKIKGGFWLSGGAEMNYRTEFRRIDVLRDFSSWQQSALLGISKKYSMGKKWKGNAQILYDFLWKEQKPQTQPVVFRVGYSF